MNRNLLRDVASIPTKSTLRAFFVPLFTLALLILFIPFLIKEHSIYTTIIVFSVIIAPIFLARIVDRIIDHHVLIIDWCLTLLILSVGIPTSVGCALIGIIFVSFSRYFVPKRLFPDFFPQTLYFCIWVESAIVLFMLGVRLTFDGKIANHKNLVVIANHQGFIDYFISLYLMGYKHKYKIVYGTNLDKYFGVYSRMVGIGVDRKSWRSKAAAQEMIGVALKEGFRIIFFPEGTRMRLWQVDQILLPFKKGGFKKIFENKAPIQAVVLDSPLAYSADDKKFPLSPGEVKVTVSTVMKTEGRNQEEMIDIIHSGMKTILSESPKMQAMVEQQSKPKIT